MEEIIERMFTVASRVNNPLSTILAGAKYSAPIFIAVALTDGRVWPERFSTDQICENELLDLVGKPKVQLYNHLDELYYQKWASEVEIITKRGGILPGGIFQKESFNTLCPKKSWSGSSCTFPGIDDQIAKLENSEALMGLEKLKDLSIIGQFMSCHKNLGS